MFATCASKAKLRNEFRKRKGLTLLLNIIYLTRMVVKVRKDKRMGKRNRKNLDISLQTIESAESVRRLIHSLSLSLEEKVAMEDQINELSHKSDCLLDIISSSNRNYRRKLFIAYQISWNEILMLLTRESMSYRIQGLGMAAIGCY